MTGERPNLEAILAEHRIDKQLASAKLIDCRCGDRYPCDARQAATYALAVEQQRDEARAAAEEAQS